MILSIETSTTACSVAIHQQGKLLVCTDLLIDQSHSGMLTTLIDQSLTYIGATYQDLTAVAIAEGPGSYTGLRIGVSTAKGLCFALNLPLIAVSTLQALAKQVMPIFGQAAYLFCPMLDARRMEVYTALYDQHLQIISPVQALVVDNDSFAQQSEQQKIVYFGNGANKCQPFFEHKNFVFVPDITPSARQIGSLASNPQTSRVVDLAYFEPLYLKEYQAPKPTK
jgi:tRNA threonylcarbamoyladenosine biosynthesis protein TsaB